MSSSTTDRRLGLSGNTAIKAPCACATTANITLSGEQTIDGVTTSASRVLVKNQTSGADNGIYVSDTGTWTRDLDFDGTNDCSRGTLVFVTQGSSNGSGLFQITTADPITIGTTSLTFSKIATLSASSVTQANVQNGQFFECSTVAGTNTITASTVGTAPASLGHGQFVFFIPANTNTGATTFNRDSLGAVAVQYNGAALIGGELQSGVECMLFHDGTVYELMATSVSNMNYKTRADVASASTVVLDTANPYSRITGTTTITAITLGNGRIRFVEFSGILTLTNGASLILPGGANITTAAGDTAIFAGEASSVVRCLSYNAASGSPITSGTNVVSLSSVSGTNTITATAPSALTAYSSNQLYVMVPASANTGATTLNVSSIGAKSIFAGGAALVGGELHSSIPVILQYDGTQFNIVGPIGKQATRTVLTSGSAATYTTPTGATRINVRMVGGGGGGGAATTNSGSNGNDTTFGNLTAAKGLGGVTQAGAGGVGGAGTNGDLNITGASGGGGSTSGADTTMAGGDGGSSFFGGAGGGGAGATAGQSATTNSGSGGGGGGSNNASYSGGGGGAGGYVEKLIAAPSSTYTYTVGSGGAGGSAGVHAGGAGAAGIIIVDEFYN